MLNIALRSAQIPRVQAASTHTPVYIFPEAESTAAATPPASTQSEMARSFCTALAALYISFHILSIYFSFALAEFSPSPRAYCTFSHKTTAEGSRKNTPDTQYSRISGSRMRIPDTAG